MRTVGQSAGGETIEFKVSSRFNQPYSARMVRIICADPNPDGVGIIEEDYSSVFSGKFPSRFQNVQLGSYATVDVQNQLPHLVKFSLVANIWPTLPDAGSQSILSLLDSQGRPLIELRIGELGELIALLTNDTIGQQRFEVTDWEISQRKWYTVWLGVDMSNHRVSLGQQPLEAEFGVHDRGFAEFECSSLSSLTEVDRLLIAASGQSGLSSFFNGKIEKPSIVEFIPKVEADLHHFPENDSDVVSLWDFAKGIDSQQIFDVGELALNGSLVNCPARAMCGSNWSGNEMCWRHAPEEYGAIHFHDDDIYDCQWETDFSFTVPATLRSGMYSMRIECEESYEDIPFYVTSAYRPAPVKNLCASFDFHVYRLYQSSPFDCRS